MQSFHDCVLPRTEDAEKIYDKASALNLTEPGMVWIVTEQALNAPNTPEGKLYDT